MFEPYNSVFDDLYGDIRSLDDIFKKPSCPGDISSVDNIFSKPSCDSDIYDLDDITGLNGYYPPVGRHVCELDAAGYLNDRDLLLVSQVSSHDGITDMTSKSVSFYDLRKRLFTDIVNAFDLHTMAFKQPFQYAVSSHNHDSLYSRVSVETNPDYAGSLCSIAEIRISTDIIDSGRYDDIHENPSAARTQVDSFTIRVPDIKFAPPPRPMIGTLRFIGAKTMRDLIAQNALNVDDHNVNPYDDNLIRDTYDGWVFPNGSTIRNINKQLSAASLVYNGNDSADITLPNINGFFRPVYPSDGMPSLTAGDAQIGLKPHTHSADPSKWTFSGLTLDTNNTKLSTTTGNSGSVYIHHGQNSPGEKWSKWRTSTVTINNGKFFPAIYTTETGDTTSEPKPEHDIIPVMMYIGGERPEAN